MYRRYYYKSMINLSLIYFVSIPQEINTNMKWNQMHTLDELLLALETKLIINSPKQIHN